MITKIFTIYYICSLLNELALTENYFITYELVYTISLL